MIRPTLAIVLGTLLLALAGFGLGRATAPSSSDAKRARESARTDAARKARRAAFDLGRNKGLAAGKRRGRELGSVAGERKGLAAGQEAAAGQATTGTTTGQITSGSSGTGSSGTGSTSGTPSVDSPVGQQIIQNSPECQAHPPPPNYHGPVQC